MPRQPLYVAYLPDDAQAVIGQVHPRPLPARKLLEQEGMHYEGYVDIFDAGPVLQGRVSELRAVRDSVLTEIGLDTEARRKASANHAGLEHEARRFPHDPVAIGAGGRRGGAAGSANCNCCTASTGDTVRTLPLNLRKNPHV
jgi:arginine N-succinyltransferase